MLGIPMASKGKQIRRSLSVLIVLLIVAACGGGGSGATTPTPSGPTLTIEGRAFGQAPAVGAGETLTVSNLDSVRHTVTSPDGRWEEVSVEGNATASLAVPADLAPGIYQFVCAVHPSMSGQLTVSG